MLALAPAVVVGLAVMVVGALLLQPVRNRVLDHALTWVQTALPGKLSVESARWSSLGSFEFEGVVWFEDADTLAAVDLLHATADLRALFRRDVRVEKLIVTGARVDLPAITARFQPGDDGAEKEAGESRFPRAGSLPGVPSIKIDVIEIDAPRLRASETVDLHRITLRAAADLSHGSAPRLQIDELSLSESVGGASIDSLWLDIDLSTFALDGNGVVHRTRGESLYLTCSSSADHTFALRLTTDPNEAPPTVMGLLLDGHATLEGFRPQSIDFTLRFRTPDTEDLLRVPALEPVLSEPLANIAPLEGARGAVGGTVRLRPSLAFAADLELYKTDWIDSAHVTVSYADRELSIESLDLALDGLALSASAHLPPTGGSATARLTVSGTQWLSNLLREAPAIDSLRVDLSIDAEGIAGVAHTDVSIRGGLAYGGVVVDTLALVARVPRQSSSPYDADLYVGAMGTALATVAHIKIAQSIEVGMRSPERYEGDLVNVLSGGVRYHTVEGGVRLDDVRLIGALGDYVINAELDSLQRGSFDVACEWPVPPALLFDYVDPDSTARAAVDSAWASDGPFAVRAAGAIARAGDTPTIDAAVQLRLPGPRDLVPLAGDGVSVDDLGPIEGTLDIASSVCDDGHAFDAGLDLGATAWMDTALVTVRVCGRSIAIDSLLFAFEGVRLAATGGRANGSWDLGATLALADSLLLARFIAGPDVPSVTLDMKARVTGPVDSPHITSSFDARYRSKDVSVPAVNGRVRVRGDSLAATVTLPQGASAYGARLDSLTVDHAGRIGGALSGSTRLSAHVPDGKFHHALRWETGDGFSIRGDTTHVRVAKQELTSRRPFDLTYSPDGGLRITGLDLRGGIGVVTADGYIAPDSADFSADIVIKHTAKPQFLDIAERLWPDSLSLSARIDSPTDFLVKGKIDGVTLAEGIPVWSSFEARADSASADGQFVIEGPKRRLLDLRGALPSYQLGGTLLDGPVIVDLSVDRLPIAFSREAFLADRADEVGRLDGRVAVRGTVRDPCAVASLQCDFTGTDGVELSKYKLIVEGLLRGEADVDTALSRIRDEWLQTELRDAETPPGLTARMSMTKAGAPIMTGELFYPVAVTLGPASVVVSDEREIKLHMKTTDIALTDFDPVLPPDVDLEGTFAVELSADGRARNPSLGGSVVTKAMRLVSARGAQISPDVEMRLGGTLFHPAVTGRIQINNGFVRVPEQQAQLLPSEGQSILWVAADSARARADTSDAFGPLAEVEDLPEFDTGLDLDVLVYIPGSFRIIGSRMNVELAGDLQLKTVDDRPVLTGQLMPLSGQLLFMGRNFELRRGHVNFYGGDELNPALDLTLTAQLGDYRVEIKLTGTTKDPEVELTSEPQLSESDIMALLVFGKPMNELNTSQSGLVQQRTAEILMVYGAVKLQEQMSQQMGVDIITIGQSTRKPDESALVVGKYLNSRTLIKYEQNLENTGAYLINLEYVLTKRIKFETFIDQASETGVEINWSKDY